MLHMSAPTATVVDTCGCALLLRSAVSGVGLLMESGQGLRSPDTSDWASRRETLVASVWMALCRGLGLGDTDSSGARKAATPQALRD